ncbi:class I adenylate-forming enzyme family protein [Streptomyces prasinopilosus]|uniref:Acyl-CoA synthetase (AMP-forming)/AMP-acid ligase II n=1 Tax=Streptomyces prasinopilosus TaxID=67344 RepID=A0A1G6LED0_9ACTN|nr:class I adenylate-forming enzyme family protein [Streptomyces prasinopilosus]SDC40936.1 Acyl-CoA synthetase (AMP-forming)/AMP-acid ligase II [Streptomyces prasinopilosus]
MTQRSWWGAELLGRHADDEVWARAADREVTFGRLRHETAWLAGVLRHYGIRARSTVALGGNVSFTYLWTLFALWSLDAQVVLVETPPGRRPRDVPPGPERVQFSVSLGEGRERPHDFVDECEVLVRRRAGGAPGTSGHCLVQFSSGTTGRPKAIGRSPESLLAELDRLAAVEGVARRGERVAVLEPLSRSFGLIGGMLHALAVGATLVLPTARTAAAAVRAASGAHVVLGNPHHFRGLAWAEPGRFPHLRLAASSGDALPPEIPAVFRGRHGVRVGQAYGTTETGIVAADLTGRFGPAGVGVPVPGTRTRVVGGVLEVHVPESPYLYDDTPWAGGWMSTRDLVTRDPLTGALRLRGRVQGVGDASVDLLRIESVLRAHRHITDAVVLGVGPIEAHVASSTELEGDELRSWCRRFLGAAPVPDRYHVLRELPRTARGKAVRDRGVLRRHRTHPPGACRCISW